MERDEGRAPLLWGAIALSAGSVVALAAYLAAFATGAAAHGLGWLFAVAVYTVLVAYAGAPIVALVSAALTTLTSPARGTHRRRVAVALALAAATLVLWFVARSEVPRGPTG